MDIVDDLAAAVDTEVHVDIRHGDTLRVEKALEKEAVFDRIDICDVQAVGYYAARRTAAAGTHGDTVALGIADKVRHDEEVIHKAHFLDHFKLVRELGTDFRTVREALCKAGLAEFAEIGIAVRLPGGELEAGQLVVAELEIEIAAVGNQKGIGNGFLLAGEEQAHLLLALEVEFLRLHLHAGFVINRFAGLDGHEDILIIRVFLIYIMGIVGEGERNARLFMEADQAGGGPLLFRDAVILDFKIKVLRAEKIAQGDGFALCFFIVPLQDTLGNIAPHASGEAEEAFGMAGEQLPINPGLDIEALGEGGAHKAA